MTSVAQSRTKPFDPSRLAAWPLLAGLAVLAIPTLVTLAHERWSSDSGAYGPFVLATGGWLLWRQWPALRAGARSGSGLITAAILIFALAGYVFGRAFDFITLEAAGVFGVGVAILQSKFGAKALARDWFPLLYLAFAIPLPVSALDALTSPLKHLVTIVATGVLRDFGLPIARQGVIIFVAQYQLFVEDACAGLNSLIGLTAVGCLYVYLLRRPLIHSIALLFLVVPLAILANTMRIISLILITYYFGDQVGQSFVHFLAGMLLFVTALLLVFAADIAIFRLTTRTGAA